MNAKDLDKLQTAARDYASEVAGMYDPEEDGDEIAYLETTIGGWEQELADGCKGGMWTGVAGYSKTEAVDLSELDAFERPEFLYTAIYEMAQILRAARADKKGGR
jgi:hypothetical protein